jgi:hypothetical protein
MQTQHVYQKQGRAFAGDLQRPSARQGGRVVVVNVLASHPANTYVAAMKYVEIGSNSLRSIITRRNSTT